MGCIQTCILFYHQSCSKQVKIIYDISLFHRSYIPYFLFKINLSGNVGHNE